MVIRVGIIGVSPQNGHPYSFSAIINGYDSANIAASGWAPIYRYLEQRPSVDFGVGDFKVTHAWTQDIQETERLCSACMVPNAVRHAADMIGEIDALILARDDWQSHWDIARPFLERGLPVFIDKPLCADEKTAKLFRPYVESGKLMTASGLRYSNELERVASRKEELGELVHINATVVNGWERYGIHLVDGLYVVADFETVAVESLPGQSHSVCLINRDGPTIVLHALGKIAPVFQFDLFGRQNHFSVNVTDNFTMFRQLLRNFEKMVVGNRPGRDPEETIDSIRILIAGAKALREDRRVTVSEIDI